MDVSKKVLSDVIIHMKYARHLLEKVRRETWEELVQRNMNMHLAKFPFLETSIREAYQFVFEKKVLPSMRTMQFAGRPIDLNNSRGFNCFSRDTRFVAFTGIQSFSDYQDGDMIKVLTHKGKWKNATVRNYGEDTLYRISFKRGRSSVVEYATKDHRWIHPDGTETTELKQGDYVMGAPNTFDNITNKTNGLFRVSSIEEYKREAVWCLEVEDDHSFVLASGISTGNCSYLPMDDVDAFSETMFLLLGGTGVGYSVQQHHIEKLPFLRGPIRAEEDGGKNKRYLISDNLEGWADTIKMLMESYFFGKKDIDFDYRDIRQKGAQLVTAGGKAPGPQPLKDCVHNIRKVLDNALQERGKNCRLTSLEVHDILCYIADAVLSGGIRRSAMISFFSYGDDDMLNCKNGPYWETNSQRGRANNTVVLLRHKLTKESFDKLWSRIQQNGTGEPGIFLTNDKNMLGNPCFRKGTLIHTKEGHFPIEDLVGKVVEVWDGTSWVSIDNFRITAQDQDIIEVELHDGSVIATTPYHSFILEGGARKEAKDLVLGDTLALSDAPLSFGDIHTHGAYLKGFLVGDGTSIKGTRAGLALYEPKFMCADRLMLSAKELPMGDVNTNAKEELSFRQHNSQKPNGSISVRKDMQGLAIYKKELYPYVTEYKKRLPIDMFSWDKSSIVDFIAGVMDADGTASDTKNGFMYQITSIHKEWLMDFQTILKMIGVQSKLSLNKNGVESRNFNDGYGNYPTQDSYRLTISQAASIALAKQVQFTRLISFADKQTTYFVKPRRNKIVALREAPKEANVYCCTVPTNHSLALSCGIQIGQCLEASLHAHTFCNLVTMLVADVCTQEEFNARCRVAAFISTLQAAYTDFHYLREDWRKNTERDALLGVSMTGIATKEFLDNVDLTAGAEIVLEENERVAKLLKINKAARTTLVKPDGCRPYNALVTTTEGLMTLQELFKDHREGEQWCEYKGTARSIQADGSSEQITQTYSNGESDIYKVTLAGQIELECTANHPWFVKEHFDHSKGIRYAPVNAFRNTTDLQAGDILDVNLGVYTKEQHSVLHPTNFFSLRMAPDTMSRITQPTEMSSDLAWLLGYLWGDGSLSENKYRLRFIDEHVWNLEKAQRVLHEVFGLDAHLYKCTDRNAHTLEVGSIELWTWFSDHGIRKYTSATMDNIPLCVRTSSKEDIIAFIAGFADADGCVYKKTPTQRALILSQTERFGFTRHLQNIALAVGLHFNHSYNRGGQNFQTDKCMILMCMSSFSLPESVELFCKYSEKAQRKFPELSFEGQGWVHMNLGKVVSVECLRKENTYDIEVANTHEFYAGAIRSHNTSSLLLGCSSGIHAWYDHYYIRRIRVGKNEPIYSYFLANNPELLEEDQIAKDTAIIVLPIKAPDGAITRNESAEDTLERVKKVYNEWIVPGHRKGSNTHNSSVTINIKPGEWESVRDWMWEHRNDYNGISVLPYDNGVYIQAPFETITKKRYDELMEKVHDIDLSMVWESQDGTNLSGEIACGGGACEIR